MAANKGSELTFIRCPSCKSLVPAVATRCRMCGHNLEQVHSEKNQESNTREDIASRDPEQDSLTPSKDFGAEVLADSLSQPSAYSEARGRDYDKYVDEEEPKINVVEEEEEPSRYEPKPKSRGLNFGAPVAPQNRRPQSPESSRTNLQNQLPDFEPDNRDNERRNTSPVSAAARGGQVRKARAEESRGEQMSRVGIDGDDVVKRKRKRRRKRKRAVRPEESFTQKEIRPSSHDMDYHNSGAELEDEEDYEDEYEGDFEDEDMAVQESLSKRESSEGADITRNLKSEIENHQTQRQEVSRNFQAKMHDREKEVVSQVVPQRRSEHISSSVSQPVISSVIPSASPLVTKSSGQELRDRDPRDREMKDSVVAPENLGQLLGWLVSFTHDGRETCRELRSGRYFITSEKLKKTDLVVDDRSISVPQCLIVARADEGVKVQDLMSLNGTFVRHFGEEDFRAAADAIRLQHGDWIKLGDFEALVCLIPLYR